MYPFYPTDPTEKSVIYLSFTLEIPVFWHFLYRVHLVWDLRFGFLASLDITWHGTRLKKYLQFWSCHHLLSWWSATGYQPSRNIQHQNITGTMEGWRRRRGCSLQMKVSHNFAHINISSTFPQHFLNISPISTSYQHMPHFINSSKLGSGVRLKVSWSSVDY